MTAFLFGLVLVLWLNRAEVRRETERRKQGSKLPEFQPKQPENPPQ